MKRRRSGKKPAPASVPTPGEHERLLLELQVHQEELRQQNEELRNSQLELEAARDRYSDLYDLGPLPHLTLDHAGTVVEANETCLAFLGLSFHKLVPRPFASLVPSACRPSARKLILTLRRKPRAMVVDLHIYAAAGEVPVELHIRPTADHQYYTAIVDLSERERTEKERRALLIEAEVARAASAAKDEFLAGLSHELRTPLTPVVAALSGLEPRLSRGELGPGELEGLVAMVRRNLDYEVRLIDDLLDASRMNFGKLALELGSVDLHATIREVIALVGAEAERKGVRLIVDLEARKRHVHGDVSRLRQVFWNLLRNAIKFTRDGGSVTVSSRNRDGLLSVEVRDTGVGIAAAELPHVFERFAQTAAGAHAGGLGLGLTIVHGIVEAHGGRVRAESRGVGKGARFSVELADVAVPARRAPAARTPAPTQPAPRPAEPGGRRILLVDDHEETAGILADLLRRQGYQVTVAHTVRAALAAGKQGADLVITDIGLPDGTGHELVERLRPTLKVPAIALTGYGRKEDVERSREAGFALHLVKPVAFPRLLRAIQELSA